VDHHGGPCPAGGQADAGQLREALKTVGTALKEGGFRFALGGGYAAWARGGPEPDHDVDFLVAADDLDGVVAHLEGRGIPVHRPAEDWLVKAYVGPALVDLIHRLGAEPVDEAWLGDAEELEVLSVRMPVMSATALLTSKLRALTERDCDLTGLLPTARAIREQVDWARVRDGCAGNPYAAAFLYLTQLLRVSPEGLVAPERTVRR